MPLVELATLWLAQSMLEEQIFPFKQTNYPKRYAEIQEDIQRFFQMVLFKQEKGPYYCCYPIL